VSKCRFSSLDALRIPALAAADFLSMIRSASPSVLIIEKYQY
jgi:hypothetical protein